MIYSRKYSRNFIPLKQDSTKHTLDFRPAIGKCLIEIKDGEGKINFYAQGIKPNMEYRLEMIGFDKGELQDAYFGGFRVDEQGKGEIRVKFNPDNVADTKRAIENFNIVSLIADVKDKPDEVSCALIGYIGNEISWKDKYKKFRFNRESEKERDINRERENIFKKDLESDIDINKPCNDEFLTKKEQGLIDKKEGLIEREKGVIEKEKGIIQKENSEELFENNDLIKFQNDLQDKENGLIQKEKGLLDKEKALNLVESELNMGNIPKEDACVRDKEVALIKQEQALIKQEQVLIKQEREIIRKKLEASYNGGLTDKEAGLIEREQGLLDKEQGLLDKEKGLIEKEKGLFELEKGLRHGNSSNNNIKATQVNQETQENYQGLDFQVKEESIPENNNHTNFKNMLDKLKRNISDIADLDNNDKVSDLSNGKDINNIQDVNMSDNDIDYNNDIDANNNFSNNFNKNYYNISDINYIKFNNAKMTPFKDFEEDVMWYRISPYELNSLTDKAWIYSNNPFVLTCYKKYSHLMLGVNNNNNYILALPCKYDENFEFNNIFNNFRDFSGISKFIPINNSLEDSLSNNDYGYMVLDL